MSRAKLRHGRAAAVLTAVALGAVGLGALAGVASCSLGLDESKITADAGVVGEGGVTPPDDGGPQTLPDGAPRPDTGVSGGDAAVGCTQDSECKASNACLKGRCDANTHACLYDVCVQTNACSAATCDVAAATCALPTTYGFHASSFQVTRGNVACNGSVARCFAAVWPFVFVGTVNRIEGYSVSNVASTPPPVRVTGVPFLPQFIVASGRRVYFVGSPGQAFPDYRLPVAWVDVPGDPFVTTLDAHGVFLVYPHNSVAAVFATVDGGIFVVNGDSGRLFPTGILRAPLHDGDRVATSPLSGIAQGASPVAASGTRLIAYRYDGTPGVYTPSFSFIPNAGTPSAQAGAETSVVTMGPLIAQSAFAQGPDGNVLFTAPALGTDDGGINVPGVRTAWLVENGGAAAFDVGARVDIETYAPSAPQGSQFTGPVAWLDTKRALVTAAYRDDRSQTVVQVISRAQLPPSTLPNRRFVLPVSPGSIGVAGSEGVGYVLAPDNQDGVTVHIFAPSCPP